VSQSRNQQQQPPAPAHILVVDDEPAVCAVVARVLQRHGHGVSTASYVDFAQAIVERGETFDLAVVDVMMPVMRGDEFARWLRARDPDAKVLFLTGHADELFKTHPVLWEGESFLEKPFTSDGLMQAVSLMLYGHPRPAA
jgi:two-component system cell cycle sensor histidine kinase/response regulator CckA